MKLNLVAKKEIPFSPFKVKGVEVVSPIGWWKVTTEGDCEGRSVRQCGTFYGHIAEIAFGIEQTPKIGRAHV